MQCGKSVCEGLYPRCYPIIDPYMLALRFLFVHQSTPSTLLLICALVVHSILGYARPSSGKRDHDARLQSHQPTFVLNILELLDSKALVPQFLIGLLLCPGAFAVHSCRTRVQWC